MKKFSVKGIIVLVAICLFIAVAMAAVNLITEPRIAEQTAKKEQEALSAVLPENAGFEKVDASAYSFPETVSGVYLDKDGEGVVVMLSIKGYDSSKPMSVAAGYDNDGTLLRVHVISVQGETSGIGTKVALPDFVSQFEGKDASLGGVDAISGATISSRAFIDAVKDGFLAVEAVMEVAG